MSTEWEFTNLVIDNYFFGVSSVAKDGSETPVVFPGPSWPLLIKPNHIKTKKDPLHDIFHKISAYRRIDLSTDVFAARFRRAGPWTWR